jgi:hypothetical protein
MNDDRKIVTAALYFFPNAGIDVREHVAQLFFQKASNGECFAIVFPLSDATVSCFEQTESASLRHVLRDIQKYVNGLAEFVGGRDDVYDFAQEVVSRFPLNFKTSQISDFPPQSLAEGALAEVAHAVRVAVQHDNPCAVPA